MLDFIFKTYKFYLIVVSSVKIFLFVFSKLIIKGIQIRLIFKHDCKILTTILQ